MPDDLVIIEHGLVLTGGTASPADLILAGSVIRAIIPPGSATSDAARRIDATGRLIIPGLINAHTHSHGGLAKGSGDLWSLELLLNAGPWLNGGRTDDDLLFVHAGRRLHARVGLAEGADRLHALVISEVRGSALRVGGQALGLSGRECEILELAGAGASNAQIAGRLRISVRTVDKHLEHALQRALAAARGASEAGRSAPHPGPGG